MKSSDLFVQFMQMIFYRLVEISSAHRISKDALNVRCQTQMVPSLQRLASLVPDGANLTIQTWSLCLEKVAMHFDGITSCLH